MALSNAKKAIMKAKINGVIEQILVATSTENVMVDDTTTLAAFLTSLQTTINGKATTEQLNAVSGTVTALQTFVGSLPEGTTATTVTGYVAEAIAALNIGDYAKAADLTDLEGRVTTAEGKLNTLIGADAGKSARAISAEEVAKIVAGADESFDTLKEIADWISTHKSDATAMNSAIVKLEGILAGIGGDGEKATVVAYVTDAIAALNIGDYAKAADLTALAARVTALEGKAHEHANKAVLDDITAEKVAAWDGKANVYFAASQPENLAEGDLWFQLV